jgi:hypothetical protein
VQAAIRRADWGDHVHVARLRQQVRHGNRYVVKHTAAQLYEIDPPISRLQAKYRRVGIGP